MAEEIITEIIEEEICLIKRGTADPEELRTFPNLTIEKQVF